MMLMMMCVYACVRTHTRAVIAVEIKIDGPSSNFGRFCLVCFDHKRSRTLLPFSLRYKPF